MALTPQLKLELPAPAIVTIFQYFGENPLLNTLSTTGVQNGIQGNETLKKEVIRVLSVVGELFNGLALIDSPLELPPHLFYQHLSVKDLAFLPPYKFSHCLEKLINDLVLKNRLTQEENESHKLNFFGWRRYEELACLLQEKNDKGLQQFARLIDEREPNLTPPSEEPSAIVQWLKQEDVTSELHEYIQFNLGGISYLPQELSLLCLDTANVDDSVGRQLSDLLIAQEQINQRMNGLEKLASTLVEQIPQIPTGEPLDLLEWLKDPANKTEIEGVTTIDLSDCDLEALPPEIGLFLNLTLLSLDDNQLEYLPREIGLLTKLEKLALQNNHFSHFPSEIAPLKGLKYLWLSENRITEIPEMFSELESLKIFYCHSNLISNLPDSIVQLEKLEWLDLDTNRFEEIPSTVAKLSKLHLLRFCKNPLKHLPEDEETLAFLKNLASQAGLDLDETPLSEAELQKVYSED